MQASISLGDLLTVLLSIAGIVALVALAMFLLQLVKTLKQVNKMLLDNKQNMDETLTNATKISKHVGVISEQAEDMINKVGPDVTDMIGKAKDIIDTAQNMTENVTDTVGFVADSVSDTALSFKHGIHSAQDYMYYVTEIVDIIKGIMKKK